MKSTKDIPKGYKQSPVGLIPKDWEVKRLGEIGSFSKGYGVPKNKMISEGYPCLTYGDLYTKYDYLIENIHSYIDKKTASESKAINKGDILFAGSGETPEDIGKCATYLGNETIYAGGDIIVLTPTKDSNSFVLPYILNSDIGGKQRYKYAQGHSVVHIYPDTLKKIQIPIPPLPEQQKIAEMLSTWDKAIELQTAIIDKLNLRKKGLMQQLLTGKKRLNGFSEIWGRIRLGDFIEFRRNNTLSRDNLNFEKGELYDIHYGDVLIKYDSILDVSKTTLPYISIPYNYDKSDCVQEGDIILADTAEDETVGKACEVINIENKTILSGLHTIHMRPRKGAFATRFLGYYINSTAFHNKLLPFIQGIKVCSLSKSNIARICLLVPSYREQCAIADILTDADNEIQKEKQKLEALEQQKKGLMQQLLTGNKRIKI